MPLVGIVVVEVHNWALDLMVLACSLASLGGHNLVLLEDHSLGLVVEEAEAYMLA